MSDITEKLNTEYATIENQEKKEFFLVPQGVYPAHAKTLNLKSRDKIVKSRNNPGSTHLADIYEIEYRIADEVADMKVNDGKKIAGTILRGNGIFVFKNPDGQKDCIPNPSGNWQYTNLLKVFGVKMKEKEVENGKGEMKTVKVLPRLSEDKILNKPCMVTVKHREWNDNTYANVVRVDKWEEGKKLEDDDLPF